MPETFSRDGRTYEWFGGFGAAFISYERGRQLGDVRMIGDHLFVVFMVNDVWFRAPKVCWRLPNVTAEQLRTLKAEMFGVECL